MLKPVTRGVAAAFALVIAGQPLRAQESKTRVTLTVSPGFVTFENFGRFGTAVARLSISRDFSRHTGGEVALFSVGLLGGASAEPLCVGSGTCEGSSTPGAFHGALVSAYAFAGESPLRLSGGLGLVSASGASGFERTSGVAVLLGADLVPRGSRSWVPTVGIRVAQFGSPVAGVRQLILPGVGFAF